MGQGSIIGYEINEKTCQISFYNDQELEPDTLEVDSDNYQIPLIIGKLRDTWAYGKEAKRLVTIKEGFTVTRLLSKSLAGDKIEFGEETYDAVWLLSQFIQMWKMIGRTLPNEDDYYRPRHVDEGGPGWCQPFTDGPLNNPDNPIEETYLQLISSAKRFLYITTPYYAVEESIQQALCIAADAGVDVRLLVPAVPDKKYAYIVAETYWGQLLRHGVRIYRYTPGFLHAKSVMADREVALIGSTNMDYRTFQLHYECGVLLYHMPVVEELLEDLDETMAKSELYTLEEWNKRSWVRRFFASILRLFAIWL